MVRVGPLAGVFHLERAFLRLHMQADGISPWTQVQFHLFDLRECSLTIVLQLSHLLLLFVIPTQVLLADLGVILIGFDLVKTDIVHQPSIYM